MEHLITYVGTVMHRSGTVKGPILLSEMVFLDSTIVVKVAKCASLCIDQPLHSFVTFDGDTTSKNFIRNIR
jgi:hypothetical protein